ncbi:hypothetical protein AB0G74_16390 [Streptomyces sp. NPDC020875]|uniref:hypothetical protein n=1 Tax=Streptomyces sp. NPDC020875 TaxID=3154898 RepID=UPI0033FBABB3
MSTTGIRDRAAVRRDRAVAVRESIDRAVRCPLCPETTAAAGLEILTRALGPGDGHLWWKSTGTIRERARQLTGDPAWRERALDWIDAYWEMHGHGPSWRHFWNAAGLWPPDTTGSLLNTVMRQLTDDRHLDGTKTPFALRRPHPGTTGPEPKR